MKILFLSAVTPYPLYSGGQIRIYNLLKRLSSRHEIWLYSFIREEAERSFAKELYFCAHVEMVFRGRAWRPEYVLPAVLGQYPFLLSTYTSARMKQILTTDLEKEHFDLIHIEPGYVWPALPTTTCPIVVSEHNIEHQVYQGYADASPIKFLLQPDVNRLKTWEQRIWQQASHVLAVSEGDAETIRATGAKAVSIVPNGVDEDVFQFQPKKTIKEQFQCLFVGDFRWLQNRDAAKFLLTDVWPLITKKYPAATLLIIGRDFPNSFQFLLDATITIKEGVKDIAAVFQQADMLLAPIRIGGGTKYKILEAMACGLPIITTAKGVEGLMMHDEDVVSLASSADEWIGAIEKILRDGTYRLRLTKQARLGIEQYYTWKTISKQLDAVWTAVYDHNKH